MKIITQDLRERRLLMRRLSESLRLKDPIKRDRRNLQQALRRQKPGEIEKQRLRDQKPEAKLRRKLRIREIRLTPEFQERERAYRRRPEVREATRIYMRERKDTPQTALRRSISGRIRTALAKNRTKKIEKTLAFVGCSMEFLRGFLESRFEPGMTWENRGREWHIDHIIPCSVFDLSDPNQQKQCFHYSNLQPLWAFENKSKGDKILRNIQPELPISLFGNNLDAVASGVEASAATVRNH